MVDKELTPKPVNSIELLTLLFVAFKLAHIIAWPWLWVVSPVWIIAIPSIISAYLKIRAKRRLEKLIANKFTDLVNKMKDVKTKEDANKIDPNLQ